MSQPKIKLNEVKIGPRQRKDLGDIPSLARSISLHGLIQPIIVDEHNNLIAGERRYRAHEYLGLEFIEFDRKGVLSEDVRAELEFEENFRRKSMTWQEEAIGILDIWRKKKLKGDLNGFEENWTLTISEQFGMSVGTVNYVLIIGKKLELEIESKIPINERKYHNASSISDAYRNVYLLEKLDAAQQHIAEKTKAAVSAGNQQTPAEARVEQAIVEQVKTIQASPEALSAERERYTSNPLNSIPFDQYWEEKCAKAKEIENTIYISNKFIHGDCITFMNDPDNRGRFDHILTDIPYGIEMDNLAQPSSGMQDIDRVAGAHDIAENMSLMEKFFPAAFHVTKDKAFVVTCCDIEQWQFMTDLAIKAGFLVQSWPYIWRKVNQSVSNQAAGYNFTKDFEIVMVYRKPSSTLMNKRNTSFTDAGNTQATKETGHPFAKPYELTKDLISAISLKGQSILDPFAGGGSMVISMLREERNVVAIEKELHHYNSLMANVKNLFYLKVNPNYIFK